MIRINLLRNLPGSGMSTRAAGPSPSVGFDSPVMTTDDMKKQAVVKLVAIALFPIAVFGWQYLETAAEHEELETLRAERNKVEAAKSALGDATPRVAEHQAKKKQLDAELSVLRELSRTRLREVKALDAIQNLMPKSTWLSKVSIDNSNVVALSGYSSSETGHTDLLTQIEESGLFREVDPKSTLQEESAFGPVKRFQVEFKIGRAERQSP